MRKIPSLFKRDRTTNLVIDEVTPGCEWALSGEGYATEKMDGTCCLVKNGQLFKRYDAKQGKAPPEDFIPAQDDTDPITGHWPGWVPVRDIPEDKWHIEAWNSIYPPTWKDWTYELVGPKIQANPYGLQSHYLSAHGQFVMTGLIDLSFEGIRQYLESFWGTSLAEGIVWWRDLTDLNCDKVKIKRRDFGLEWPVKNNE